jgi:hypothetical protein
MVHIINYANEISNMNAIDVVCLMVFNVTFNNITVISWWSVNFPAHMISCLTEIPLYRLIIYIDGRIL